MTSTVQLYHIYHHYTILHVCTLIGYDDTEAVKLMTVPGSIIEIEESITANFPGDEQYFGQMRGKELFKFPPGHAAKLKSFISEIQSKHT